MTDCIFCKIVKGELPSYQVYDDPHFLAFMDIRPINPGHIVIIPRLHADRVFDLSPELYHELFEVARKLAGPLRHASGAQRIGLAVEGFGVAHAHVHLVPVNNIGELDPHRAIIGLPEELKQWSIKIKKAIG